MRVPFFRAAALAAALLLAACAGSPATGAVQADAGSRPVTAAPGAEFPLAPGDKVKVTVFGQPDLSGEFVVDGSGAIGVPYVGQVKVAGRTASQAGAAVAEALRRAQILNEPRVVAEALTIRPLYILGEVNKPGEYPFRPGMSLYAAVATAGGYTFRADPGQVLIRKAGETAFSRYDLAGDIAVYPGDVIQVPQRFF